MYADSSLQALSRRGPGRESWEMRLSVFDELRVAAWASSDELVDLTALVDEHVAPARRMTALIAGWDRLAKRAAALVASGPRLRASGVTLRAPQPEPSKIVAAPVNYELHQQEMGGEAGVYVGERVETIRTYAGFVKAPTSIVGPDEPIELPYPDRRTDYEGELGVVVGAPARRVPRDRALEYVFGYVPLLDITLRGREDRSFRKSFDTFTPIGPWIVTADEIGDPGRLRFELRLNGEVRQAASTSSLIYDVPRLVELYSSAMTLLPGDLIATGTPEGVGGLRAGDEIDLWIERVGALHMRVDARDRSAAPV
jgi:2-keto-4-pentenoate hydratase/2-oxohepta-3-ene-1,7-dioic acid hydratase in catechol pathway